MKQPPYPIVCLGLLSLLFSPANTLAFDSGMDPVYASSGRPYGKKAHAIGEGITPGDDDREYDYERDSKEKQEEDRLRSIIFPTVTTGISWDDNIYRLDRYQESSTILHLRPAVNIQTSRRANRLYGGYKGDYAWYANDPTDNLSYFDHNLNIGADHTGRKNYYGAYAEYQRGHDQPGGIDSNADRFDNWEQYLLMGWWKYGTDEARLNFRLDGELDDRVYDKFRSNDVRTQALAGMLKARFTGKTRGVLEGGIRRFRYDNSNQDGDRYYVRLGLNWDATAKTQGIFTWGYEEFRSDNPGDPLDSDQPGPVFGVNQDYDGTTWKASIRWEPRERDTLLFNSGRGIRVSNGVGSSKVSTRHDIAWTHVWSGRVRSHLGFAIGEDDYQGVDRVDDLKEFQLSASYLWRRNLLFTAAWFYEKRDSNVDLQNYRRNLLELLVHWEY